MTYQEYLKTDYWKAVSDAVKKRADYRCQLCNSQHDLCAHHRTYERRGRELDSLSDLTCLCRRCHEIFHGKQEPIKPTEPVERKAPKKKVFDGALDIRNVDHEMPGGSSEWIVLTDALIGRCATLAGGFTTATLESLGSNGLKGWRYRLRGKSVSRFSYKKALQGRYILGTKRAKIFAHELQQNAAKS